MSGCFCLGTITIHIKLYIYIEILLDAHGWAVTSNPDGPSPKKRLGGTERDQSAATRQRTSGVALGLQRPEFGG